MRYAVLLLVFYLLGPELMAQRDTTFWFVAPDVSQQHEDRPVNFRISTENESALVRVSQPANSQFAPVVLSINANSTRSVRFDGSQIGLIENSPPNQILNKGFLIESSSLVTAYYDVGQLLNIDIFTLKGRNALGQEFIIPGQNLWSNDSNPDSYSTFEIVATEDNTIVEFIPTIDVVGHTAGEKVRFKLNRGQTYSARAINRQAAFTLAGTVVTSNKPIAITFQDDSIEARSGGCRDLTGDQIVPLGVLGKEYIVQRGKLFQDEMVMVTTTKDNTSINVNGQSLGTLGAREILRIAVTSSLFIESDQPIYVIQYSGIGCEIGAALIPSINCTGSNQIAFSRSGDQDFTINIIVPSGGESGFELNGQTHLISSSSFMDVPGTNGGWKAASIDFQTSQIAPGTANIIENAEFSFQLGFLDGGEFSGTRFGYLSNFSSLFIGDDITLCEGQERRIFPKGDPDAIYKWSDGSNGSSIVVSEAGKYWVTTTNSAGCMLSDTLEVVVQLSDFLTLPPEMTGCDGDTVFVDPGDHFSYLWSDGSTDRILKVVEPGDYALEVTDIKGCDDQAMVSVTFQDRPSLDLGADLITCIRDSVILESNILNAESYEWLDGSSGLEFKTDQAGVYWLEIELGVCTVRDTVVIENHPTPELDSIRGSRSVCPGLTSVEYMANFSEGLTYDWSVDGGIITGDNGNSSVLIDWGDTKADASVSLLETNEFGCRSEVYNFDVRINRFLETQKPQGPDSLCANKPTGIPYSIQNTNGSTYTWNITGGQVASGQGTNEITIDWDGPGIHQVQVDESSTTQLDVCFGSSDVLDILVFNDTTSIEFQSVSVHPAFNVDVFISWELQDVGQNVTELRLFRRSTGGVWRPLSTLSPTAVSYTDQSLNTANVVYAYRLELVNGCDELITSVEHNSIVLSAFGDEERNTIALTWNPYDGWDSGVDQYAILRKIDDEDNFVEIARTEGSNTSFVMENASDAFVHEIRIMALELDGDFSSLSNTVELEFDHNITIPNVFTPNGDNINETFEIPKIELYEDNELRIFRRDGKEVFRAQGYTSEWEGGNLPAGPYYYVLTLKKLNQTINGSIYILK